jgi:hypothetical protein
VSQKAVQIDSSATIGAEMFKGVMQDLVWQRSGSFSLRATPALLWFDGRGLWKTGLFSALRKALEGDPSNKRPTDMVGRRKALLESFDKFVKITWVRRTTVVFEVKNACARQGVMLDNDLFNEVIE